VEPRAVARASMLELSSDSDSDSDSNNEVEPYVGLGTEPFIDTVDKSVMALNNIKKYVQKRTSVIAVDLEWVGEGRASQLCLLQLAVPNDRVYLFDFISVEADDIWKSGLKEILESSTILKVFHDCRHDADILQRAGVTLTNVFDTQIAYAMYRRQQGFATPLPVSLNTLLKNKQLSEIYNWCWWE